MVRKLTIALLNIIFYFASVTCAELVLNAQDKSQPLVVLYLPSSGHIHQIVPISNDDKTITYNSGQATLITACPSDQPMINNALFQTDEIQNKCKKASKPIIHTKIMGSGVEGYSVGYWLYHHTRTTERKYSSRPTFVTIFELYHSQRDSNTLYYTSHDIFPASKITLVDEENTKIESRFKVKSSPDLPEEIQLVPIEDFAPMPWKTTTRFDINYVTADERIKECVNELNEFLRDYVNTTRIPLKIYSGKRGSSWYWKVVRNMDIGLLLIVVKSDSREFPKPCETECKKFGLKKLKQLIPELHCCPLFERLASELHLVLIGNDSIVEYLRFTNEIIFIEKIEKTPENTETSEKTEQTTNMEEG